MPPTRTHRSTPSRKKSCLPCARAKVRCGLERPSCARCVASKRQCAYATAAPRSPTARAASPTDIPVQAPPSPNPRAAALTSIATPASLSTVFTDAADATAATASAFSESPAHPPAPRQSQRRDGEALNFALLDLVPLAGADQIRDRWLRPFLAVTDQQEVPKAFHPYTLQYMSCVLRTYPKQMADGEPPFLHPMQLTGEHVVLANCYSLARLWHNRAVGSEAIVADTVRREMDRLAHDRNVDDIDHLAAFQAYLVYSLMAYFFPIAGSPLVNDATMVTLQEMAFCAAQGGLVSQAELAGTRPTWESWIVAAAKRRAMFAFYLLSSVYNADNNVPNFLAEELRDVFAPDAKLVWEARTREAWQREYARHLARWPDGPLKISELWRSPETGSERRRERVDRWVQHADEFGMMLFAVCVHLHGY
ncbi:C6 finger domain-containingprotein [Purpureocillium lavendulum]|uniref:C6 finger domain-containingprotein n=1 Tax=Purpureocillium lavendulum TaxID=1247861 RepID=A0AB34FVG6_9HYPO|nr:C6 finger domain-containingprotein [Purpureocillium lavendulum]